MVIDWNVSVQISLPSPCPAVPMTFITDEGMPQRRVVKMSQSSIKKSNFMMTLEPTRSRTTTPEMTPRVMVTLMNVWVLSRMGTSQEELVAFLVTASGVRACYGN